MLSLAFQASTAFEAASSIAHAAPVRRIPAARSSPVAVYQLNDEEELFAIRSKLETVDSSRNHYSATLVQSGAMAASFAAASVLLPYASSFYALSYDAYFGAAFAEALSQLGSLSHLSFNMLMHHSAPPPEPVATGLLDTLLKNPDAAESLAASWMLLIGSGYTRYAVQHKRGHLYPTCSDVQWRCKVTKARLDLAKWQASCIFAQRQALAQRAFRNFAVKYYRCQPHHVTFDTAGAMERIRGAVLVGDAALRANENLIAQTDGLTIEVNTIEMSQSELVSPPPPLPSPSPSPLPLLPPQP